MITPTKRRITKRALMPQLSPWSSGHCPQKRARISKRRAQGPCLQHFGESDEHTSMHELSKLLSLYPSLQIEQSGPALFPAHSLSPPALPRNNNTR